jgi:hypothetical protein
MCVRAPDLLHDSWMYVTDTFICAAFRPTAASTARTSRRTAERLAASRSWCIQESNLEFNCAWLTNAARVDLLWVSRVQATKSVHASVARGACVACGSAGSRMLRRAHGKAHGPVNPASLCYDFSRCGSGTTAFAVALCVGRTLLWVLRTRLQPVTRVLSNRSCAPVLRCKHNFVCAACRSLDIFSFGVLIWVMLTRQYPWQASQATAALSDTAAMLVPCHIYLWSDVGLYRLYANPIHVMTTGPAHARVPAANGGWGRAAGGATGAWCAAGRQRAPA